MKKLVAYYLSFCILFLVTANVAQAQFITQAPADDANLTRQSFVLRFDDGYETRAEITYPKNTPGTLPAVLLLGGSDQTDMDGATTPPPNIKNYKEMTDNLTKNGFITLRYNKRGVTTNGQPAPGGNVTRTHEILVKDAAAAMRRLVSDPKTDKNKVFIVGHSQGTVIAAQTARNFPENVKGLLLTGAIPDWNVAFDYQLVDRYLRAATETDANQDGTLDSDELSKALSNDLTVFANAERSNLLYEKVMVYYPRPNVLPGRPVQVGAIRADAGVDKDADGKLSIEKELKPALVDVRTKFLDNEGLLKNSGETRQAWESMLAAPKLSDVLAQVKLPVQFMHGGLDERMPQERVREVASGLQNAGVPVTFRLYTEVDHNFIPGDLKAKLLAGQRLTAANQSIPSAAPSSPVTVTPVPAGGQPAPAMPQPQPQPVLPSTGVGSVPGNDSSWQLWLILVFVLGGSGASGALAYRYRTSRRV
jgi:pimeloyl-ACP methyl ester carboxylesterase